MFEMDKALVFNYEDILFSTDGFADASLLGHGSYGSVYYGVLHDQVFTNLDNIYIYVYYYF